MSETIVQMSKTVDPVSGAVTYHEIPTPPAAQAAPAPVSTPASAPAVTVAAPEHAYTQHSFRVSPSLLEVVVFVGGLASLVALQITGHATPAIDNSLFMLIGGSAGHGIGRAFTLK